MKKNQTIIAILLLAGTVISILFIDKPLALYIESSVNDNAGFLTSFLTGLETITGFNISKYLLALILSVVGIIFLIKSRSSRTGYIFLFIGLVHFLSRIIAGALKNVFDRIRPYQFIEDNSLGDFFVEGGSSFPSGHVAHFFSLFIPIVLLFPRKTWWLLFVPLLVLLQRVLVNDHYLSDTIASVFIVYVLSILFRKLFIRLTIRKLAK